jgi:hydroxymethylpyrimidine/phosphomethylpyrimidine kinase
MRANNLSMSILKPPTVLTVAGFDPSGGAGVLADARTFAAFGLEAAAAITSITFQTSEKVFGAVHQAAETLRSQLGPLVDGSNIVSTKTGMLPTKEIVLEVARLFREAELPAPVVDPVINSSSGYQLIEADALSAFAENLLPLARVITPNISEAEILSGKTISSEADMRSAAATIRARGARAVLVKGGHLDEKTADAIDVLDDEGEVTVFRVQRIAGAQVHGSGCVLSAAIAACLGNGMTLQQSVAEAKGFVLEALRKSVSSTAV